MNGVIAASRLRGLPEPNTFIGDVADVIPDAATLAQFSNDLSVSDIKEFEIQGNNIRCYINKLFTLTQGFTGIYTGLTYFLDLNNNCDGVSDNIFRNGSNRFIYLPNAISAGARAFAFINGSSFIVIPKMINLGGTAGANSVFSATTGTLITNKILETNNGGNPDGDIQEFIANGGSVTYKDLTNPTQNTSPNAATISVNTIGGTYVELNVSQPTHVNTLKYALVFVDGFFQDVYDINNLYVINLQKQTSYDIKIIIADEYFNISPYSNTINVTTATIDIAALFQNAVAYYKLDETSGDAIDVVNGYNGTLVGGVTQGVAGKIGTAYSFDGVDGRLQLPLNIWDNITSTDFTFSCWVMSRNVNNTQIICSDVSPVFSGSIIQVYFNNGIIRWDISDNGSVGGITSSVNVSNNVFYFIQIKINTNGDAVMKIDNQIVGTYTYINPSQSLRQLSLGMRADANFPLDGVIDEVSFINGQTTSAQDSELYNNGNGSTI